MKASEMAKMDTERRERLERANALIETIAGCGRRFFRRGEHVARFAIIGGRLYFVDEYSDRAIYMHRPAPTRYFTNGGTLWSLCRALYRYVWFGEILRGHLGPWPAECCGGDLWGYGDSMESVRTRALELGVWQSPGARA